MCPILGKQAKTCPFAVKCKLPSRISVRIDEESFTIAVTDEFCPRQIGSSVDIYRRQAEQISTCNTCRSEALTWDLIYYGVIHQACVWRLLALSQADWAGNKTSSLNISSRIFSMPRIRFSHFFDSFDFSVRLLSKSTFRLSQLSQTID